MIRKAECCCGKTSLELEGDPVLYNVCHCSVNCKKRTGSAFGLEAYFFENQVLHKTGSTKIYKNNNVKDKPHDVYFCSNCGTSLYWYWTPPNGYIGVSGGCFVTIPPLEPKFHYKVEDKCSWLSLPDIKTISRSDVPWLSE